MTPIVHSIHYPIAIDKGVGTLKEEQNYARHVEQMMMQVLFTNPGERVNRPDFGCGLRRMVFAPNSDVTANLLQVLILQSLERWLGNVISLIDVTVKAINERLEVGIVYLIKARQERRFLNIDVTL
jgi:uncharacterized protein